MVSNHFVHDEPEELLAECRVEARRVGQRTQSCNLHRLPIRIGRCEADLRFVLTHSFGDFEPLCKQVDECSVDVVNAVSTFAKYLVVVHDVERSDCDQREFSRSLRLPVMTNHDEFSVQAKIVTVSDGVVYGTREDRSGAALEEHLGLLGFDVTERAVTEDGTHAVRTTLERMAQGFNGVIVTTGGTGFGPRDLTPEGTRAAIEREAPGLAEAMRLVNPLGRLSRGICGTIGEALVVNTPGSTKGCIETFDAIADVVPHAVRLMRDNTDPHPHDEAPSDAAHQAPARGDHDG